jgi:hypothetical protein
MPIAITIRQNDWFIASFRLDGAALSHEAARGRESTHGVLLDRGRPLIECAGLWLSKMTAHIYLTVYPPEHRVDVDQEQERQRLRKERERLNRQIANLIAESGQKAGGDPLEIEQHRERLEEHQREFRAFRVDLERFHRLYGRLGE